MNEILQWVCIILIGAATIIPPATRVWRDFKEENYDV